MPEELPPAVGPVLITFTEQDIALFSAASGDRNPLHLNEAYARRTYYGQPVVFGCLGAIACLGHIGLPEGLSATSLEANFLRPMFLGVTYRVERLEKKGRWEARLLDGSLPVVSVAIKAGPTQSEEARDVAEAAPLFENHEAAVRSEESIAPGLSVAGSYRCDPAALSRLNARWGVADRRLATVLSWASYLIGMKLPGESALFSKLVMKFGDPAPALSAIHYHAAVESLDSRFGLACIEFSLLVGDSTFASGECWSYVRPMLPEVEETDSEEPHTDSLSGKVALIVGSSRGLGAAMKRALEQRGAVVYGIARSTDGTDMQRLEVGDAADPETLSRLRARILQEHGRLDLLVCNAFPSVLPLRLEPNGVERIGAYIERATALTLAPLCEFLEVLNQSSGCALIVSSSAVEQPVKEWPHYIAAKRAVEGLAEVASLQHTRVATLIVRPPKLLTAMTNTPMGRLGAISPAMIANRIATRLEAPLEPGKTEILTFLEGDS